MLVKEPDEYRITTKTKKMKKYLSFDGTAKRSEYWGVTIVTFIMLMIGITIGVVIMSSHTQASFVTGFMAMIGSAICYVWVFLAVTIRRCRDADISPWWTAACFIPSVGWVPWIIIGCLGSESKENNHV